MEAAKDVFNSIVEGRYRFGVDLGLITGHKFTEKKEARGAKQCKAISFSEELHY